MDNFVLNTPVLLIIYCRLDTTKEVFEKIREARPRKLYIASDGPKEGATEDMKRRIMETRDWVVSNVDWDCEVFTDFAEKNMGCRLRPSSAISWVFEHEETAIILEDDIVPDISFFRYCQEMLLKYQNDDRIMTISGYKAVDDFEITTDYFFSFFSPIWGWATWKRAWEKYDVNVPFWPEVKKKKLLKQYFRYATVKCMERDFDSVYSNRIDSWAYQWLLTRIAYNGLGIVPKHNLIRNIGFESELATHTSGEKMCFPVHHMIFPIKEVIDVKRNEEYDLAYEISHFKYNILKEAVKKITPSFLLKWYHGLK